MAVNFKENVPGHENDSNCGNVTGIAQLKPLIETLKNKNDELNNDISVLKKLVYMLNVELERRESLPSGNSELNHVPPDLSFDKNYLNNSDIQSIEPLLRAFELTKKEKDELLSNYKRTFDKFSHRCKEIISENVCLRQQLNECKEKADSSIIEWKNLHEKFILSEEHNQLLTRQVKLLQNKNQSIESIFRNQLKQSYDEKNKLDEKLESTKTELLLLKGRMGILSVNKAQPMTENNFKQDSTFTTIITELKKLSSELKLYQTTEVETLRTNQKTLESLKCDLEIRLAAITSERDHLSGYVSALKLDSSQINNKIKILEEELQTAKKNEDDARLQLMKSMDVIRELIHSGKTASSETLPVDNHPNSNNSD